MTRRRRTLFFLFLMGIGSAVVVWGVRWWNRRQAAENITAACRWAGLADLPPAAQGVRVYRNDTLTWTGYLVKFSAPSNAIDTFLTASPGLQAAPAEVFSPRHRYIRAVSRADIDSPQFAGDRLFFDSNAPLQTAPWFDRTITQKGRRYVVQWQDNNGEVVINDVTHTVYITVADS